MPGELNGVQAHIKKIHPFAMYVHCSAHSLNLLVSKSFSAAEFIQQRLLIKLRYSLWLFHLSKKKICFTLSNWKFFQDIIKKTLKRSWETRRIERFHTVNDFIELYNHVIESLEIISEWVDSKTSGKARTLRNAVLNLEFLVSLFVLNKGFSKGLPLSKLLQDLSENSEEVFKDIYGQVKILAESLDIEIKMPRLSNRQIHKNNVPAISL